MHKKQSILKDFFCRETGATAIEYSLLVGGLAATIAVIVFTIGADIAASLGNIGKFLTITP